MVRNGAVATKQRMLRDREMETEVKGKRLRRWYSGERGRRTLGVRGGAAVAGHGELVHHQEDEHGEVKDRSHIAQHGGTSKQCGVDSSAAPLVTSHQVLHGALHLQGGKMGRIMGPHTGYRKGASADDA